MKEIWNNIKEYEGLYQVSNLGRIKSLERELKNVNGKILKYKEKIMKPQLNSRGYLIVVLRKNKIKKNFRVHRLVARAFLPKPNNKNIVNHIDNNPENNKANNLEWCTQSENIKHAFRIGVCNKTIENCKKLGKQKSKKVVQYTLNKEIVKIWDSITEASIKTNICRPNIVKCCKEEYGRKSAGGYIWKYLII